MNDDTLIATLREVATHYYRLLATAQERGYEIRQPIGAAYYNKDEPPVIEVWKKV